MSDLVTGEVRVPAEPGVLDRVEARILELGGEYRPIGGNEVERYPYVHLFTPGLYSRQIRIPAGEILTSRIHKTEHPFVISEGRCMVMAEGEPWVELEAPHMGVTFPGTRRMLVILEDVTWTTFHATDLTDVESIEREILVDYENPLLEETT